LAVPNDPIFTGFDTPTQGIRFGGGGIDLTNAQDLIIGY